ncbi:type I CRISPR-associated protein Cas7 [Endozoicomonas acroporae]|uniref:type I CRISPR-associated protein Cas7 n=1 Tax=Endozoicomonas acroporae TaxID=1701104 RepID=UPI000C780894|nr:type I CRISPR-associated protein Cas7 [Endozoicomonas acroporae]
MYQNSMVLQHPRDIFFFYDIEQGNPNGDPDQDGAVRYDDEVRKANVTGICKKRKIRDRVSIMMGNSSPHEIYFSNSEIVLNDHHLWALSAGVIQ